MNHESTAKFKIPTSLPDSEPKSTFADSTKDIFADLEATLTEVAESNPRITSESTEPSSRDRDLRALLEVSLAVNSSLLLDETLELVMAKAVELMQAERGFIMLLDENDQLQIRAKFNLDKEKTSEEDLKISRSIAHNVLTTGKSIYTSDAQEDDRYANQESIIELHLRSIMSVPLMLKEEVFGVIYLDNSSQARMFLKSDLYLLELYAQMVSNTLHNAGIYDSMSSLKRYNDSVVQNSPVGLVVLDSEAHILTINPKALEILDLNKDSISTVLDSGSDVTDFLDLLPPKEANRWRTKISMVLSTGEEVSESRFYHNTGYFEKVLSLRLSPLADLPRDGDGLIMAIEDITDKVTMEQYVILSEKLVARGEMAASVAHELNNFLAIIANNAELLTINVGREKFDKVALNCKSISENVFKTKRFVDSLMDFSKPEPSYLTYDIKRLIDDLLFSLRVQPRFKWVHFTIDLADDIPPVEIDVGQIQQVLLNLLNNASDAIDERVSTLDQEKDDIKREIGISASYDNARDEISASVSDNGTGMSEERQGKIFSLHYTTKKGGHGLGLYNCKSIAEQHGGRLELASKLDVGTTFTLTIPRYQPDRD